MSCHAARYVLLKNQKDLNAPVVLHFHGSGVELMHERTSQQGVQFASFFYVSPGETAADYLQPQLAEKYRDRSSVACESRSLRLFPHCFTVDDRTSRFTYSLQTTEDMVSFKVIDRTESGSSLCTQVVHG